jgi:hypothetical protein
MKIRISENQLNMIRSRLKEGVEDVYSVSAKPTGIYGLKDARIDGLAIEDAECDAITVKFMIELDEKRNGIHGASVHNVVGDEEVDVKFILLNDNVKNPNREDYTEKVITIPILWDKITINEDRDLGSVILDDLELQYVNEGGKIYLEPIATFGVFGRNNYDR